MTEKSSDVASKPTTEELSGTQGPTQGRTLPLERSQSSGASGTGGKDATKGQTAIESTDTKDNKDDGSKATAATGPSEKDSPGPEEEPKDGKGPTEKKLSRGVDPNKVKKKRVFEEVKKISREEKKPSKETESESSDSSREVENEQQKQNVIKKLETLKELKKQAKKEEEEYLKVRAAQVLDKYKPKSKAAQLRASDDRVPMNYSTQLKKMVDSGNFGVIKSMYLAIRPNGRYATWPGKEYDDKHKAQKFVPVAERVRLSRHKKKEAPVMTKADLKKKERELEKLVSNAHRKMTKEEIDALPHLPKEGDPPPPPPPSSPPRVERCPIEEDGQPFWQAVPDENQDSYASESDEYMVKEEDVHHDKLIRPEHIKRNKHKYPCKPFASLEEMQELDKIIAPICHKDNVKAYTMIQAHKVFRLGINIQRDPNMPLPEDPYAIPTDPKNDNKQLKTAHSKSLPVKPLPSCSTPIVPGCDAKPRRAQFMNMKRVIFYTKGAEAVHEMDKLDRKAKEELGMKISIVPIQYKEE